ncbi:PEP-CTERM sorting domain-containing protein [Luteolibacter sp. GHJ8]|uniref:PEP-CTERM sorting domain-containing protein n=1 Tax=Luteolibacter rhizosphaerae TaxID=2989719 RepID=A0ABT3G2Q3_9BACT|nr:PEP-CTERM sorting domain-containing protein [Luteolibacter rhizosphaerae]MCW1914118.1 PEP-CTERM sorting domain-containing protein [Luteolibacter rhizosphaerae]
MTTSLSPLWRGLALLTCSLATSNAVVLFTDNFDATAPGSPNDQITNPGRQGGTLATVGYQQLNNVQIGNLTTLPPSPGSDLGDEFLAAFSGRAFVNHNFSSETLPLEISFRGLISSTSATGLDNWVSVTVGDVSGMPFVNGANVASILFRANGGTEVWNHGSNSVGGAGASVGYNAWTDYRIVLSDTAGTGSAFAGNGSRIDYYANGVLLGTANINQLTAQDGFIGFASDRIVGYDNLSIVTVPEPSAMLIALGGLGSLFLRRRRK